MEHNKKSGQTNVLNDGRVPSFYYRKINDIDEHAVGARLRSIRESLGLTLVEMAELLHISYGGLRKLEMGMSNPSGRTLILLHEVYGVDIVWLLYGRHSTHADILSALYALDESARFDIFTRLYSYFITKDDISLVPSHGVCKGVEHFAEWDKTFYKPIQPEGPAEDEVLYQNSERFDRLNSYLEQEVMELDKEVGDAKGISTTDKDAFFRVLNHLMDKKEG